jgi:transposase
MVRRLSLTEDQRQELVRLRDHDPRPYVRERGAAILKIAEGQSAHRVAQSGLLKPRDPDTIYAWLDRYETDGTAGLIAHPQGGSRGRYL